MSTLRAEQALLAALKTDNPDIDEYPETYLRWMAGELARALAVKASSIEVGGSFADRVRQICFNLPKAHNHERRRALCNRTMSASSISELGADAWASRERQAERRAESVKRRKLVTITNGAAAVRTRSVRCSACSARDAMAQAVGEQRESRKGETWGSKDHDEASHRARLECNICGYVWHADDAPLYYDEVAEEEPDAETQNASAGRDQMPIGDATPVPDAHSLQASHSSAIQPTLLSTSEAGASVASPAPNAAPPSRTAAVHTLVAAMLRAAGPLGAEHDAFLGSGPERIAARMEEVVWTSGDVGAPLSSTADRLARLAEHAKRVGLLAARLTGAVLDELAVGEVGPEQLAADT
jgi:hypothetical protein